jgi:hypothetical protein
MKKTNIDKYHEQQLRDPAVAARFEQAGDAWSVALQITALRTKAGLPQKDPAKLLKISQQQISRPGFPGYEGTCSALYAVSPRLCTPVSMSLSSRKACGRACVWRSSPRYGTKRTAAKGDPMPITQIFKSIRRPLHE